MFRDELSVEICKWGGPFTLFFATPSIAIIFGAVVLEAVEQGRDVPFKTVAMMVLFVAFCLAISVFACRIGRGWFGGDKY